MTQPLPALGADHVVEATKSYSYSQIKLMRDAIAPRAPVVKLEDFAAFGDSGTPAGMISSDNAASLLIAGSCEGQLARADLPDEAIAEPRDELGSLGWGPPPGATATAARTQDPADVPVARVGALEWAPAQAEVAAVPEPIDDEAATARLGLSLEQPPAEHEELGEAPAEEPEGVTSERRRRPYLAVALALVAALIGLWLQFGARAGAEAGDVAGELTLAVPPSPAVDSAVPERAQIPEVSEPTQIPEVPIAPPVVVASDPVEAQPSPARGGSAPEAPTQELETPAFETERCLIKRRRADRAYVDGDWKRLEVLTRASGCWSDSSRVKTLRMGALFELGRLAECAKIGSRSKHPKVVTLRKRCAIARE